MSPQFPEESTVTQDYLKAVWALGERSPKGASVTGLARRLGVVPSTASENVARLVDAGLLHHQPYRAVTLTETGRIQAMGMVRRHRILETYLVEELGFDWDEVHDEAEVLEHAISDRLLQHLDSALGYPLRDPHGDPIPQADGTIVAPPLRGVETLKPGESGVVARMSDSTDILQTLTAAGIRLDRQITVLSRQKEASGESEKAHWMNTVQGPNANVSVPDGSLWVLE